MYPKPTLILAILTVMSACDSEEPGHHAARPMLTPAEIACDHLEFGPFVTVSLDAGEASIEPHTRSDVALAEMEEARLTIEPGMAGVVYFMIDQDLPLKLLDPAGREVAVEPVDLTACDRAAVGVQADLKNVPYTLVVGPAVQTQVAVVVHVTQAEGAHGGHGALPVPPAFADLTNPFAEDPEALAEGEALYEGQCAACHAQDGRGEGPTASGETPAPTDVVESARAQSDGYLFWRLSEGRDASGNPSTMPAFGRLLLEDQIWFVVTYLRSLD